jgi:glycosyltransferase involved in cell wall biosynthesis
MRIGILSTCEHYAWAGTEEVWYHFAKHALECGHEVVLGAHVKVANSSQAKELQSSGLQICSRNPRKPVRFYLLTERLRSQMKRLEACDVIVVNAGSLYDTLNLPWIGRTVTELARSGKRIVYFCHFCAESLPATNHSRKNISDFVSAVSEWVFVSEHNRHLAGRQLATRFQRSSVVMNGPRLQLDEPLAMPSGSVTFGCVARLETRWKGHDVLLECLAQPEWRSRDWQLNIYGSGPDEGYLRDLIRYYALNDHVQMRGYVREMKDVWKECHLKVLASHGEGTPLAVLEAMMCGRAVITTDVGGNREILQHDESGFIADAATPRCFSSMLETAWRAQDRWQDMGIAAFHSARRLALANPADKLLKLIENPV